MWLGFSLKESTTTCFLWEIKYREIYQQRQLDNLIFLNKMDELGDFCMEKIKAKAVRQFNFQ